MQVRGLIFIVGNRGVIDIGDFIESQLAVEFEIPVPLGHVVAVITVRGQLLHRFMSGFLMISIEDAPRAPARDVLQTGIQHSQPAAVTKTCMKISVATQLRRYPTLSHTALEV